MTIRPFSKSVFRRINRMVAELLWLELVWIVDWWAGVKVIFIYLFILLKFKLLLIVLITCICV